MPVLDLRRCLNAISDVVNNRPRPIRKFDQIFMKTADMLLQTEHVGNVFEGKRVVFIGDGDAIGLCLVHLHNSRLLEHGPTKVHVLDFDERVVQSVERFARRYGIDGRVTAELYNVADPLPVDHWGRFDCFYTNPPFGKHNGGQSVIAFLRRGIEAVGTDALGCIVIADDDRHAWASTVLYNAQREVVEQGFAVSELIPDFHSYHLESDPDLKSCSMVIRRVVPAVADYSSQPLPPGMHRSFYGESNPLRIKYVRALTGEGGHPPDDHKYEFYPEEGCVHGQPDDRTGCVPVHESR
jgi:predicted methyltransferase